MPSYLLLLWAVLLPVNSVWAIPISDIPNPRKLNGTWVSDVANILSPETEVQLNQRIDRLTAQNGSEIAVVTVPDTAPAVTVKSYATQLFNTWGIGKLGIDNGVLFLIAVKERRIEIETGRGINPYISDRQVAQVIKDLITPEFKRQNFDLGIINGVEEIAGRIEKINFYPFPFTPMYSSLGIIGIVIAIYGGSLFTKKIKDWAQKLPTIDHNFQNSVVFQLKIPQLEKLANLEMWLIISGLVAFSISANAWVLSQESWTNLFINPFNQFIATLLVNLIVAITTIPIWLGLERVWLKQLAQVFEYPIQRYEVDQVSVLVLRKSYLILVFHLPALAISWLLGNT
ncbi:MAG: TPM domain-containing protein, partial [Pseudanabaena sp.]